VRVPVKSQTANAAEIPVTSDSTASSLQPLPPPLRRLAALSVGLQPYAYSVLVRPGKS